MQILKQKGKNRKKLILIKYTKTMIFFNFEHNIILNSLWAWGFFVSTIIHNSTEVISHNYMILYSMAQSFLKIFLPHVNLSQGASCSFLYIFGFWKRKSFFLPSTFQIIQKHGSIILFLLFLFGLLARSALYLLNSFFKS